MLIDIFNEIPWQKFQQLKDIKNLPLNEQEEKYQYYLSELNLARDFYYQYQVKGKRSGNTTNAKPCSEGMDVVFLIDYTASMGAEIDDVKLNVISIVNTIITESGGDYRLGLTLFDEYEVAGTIPYASKTAYTSLPASQKITTSPSTNPTTGRDIYQVLTTMEMMSLGNQATFNTQLGLLNTVSFPLGKGAGSASTGEPGDISLQEIINNDFVGTFREGVAKLIILMTDDEPGGYNGDYDSNTISRLEALKTTCINEGIQLLVLSQLAILPNTSYRIISDNADGLYDNTLDSTTVISSIEDICTLNV